MSIKFESFKQMIREANTAPELLSVDWIGFAMEKASKVKMTLEQRMFYEMTMARIATIIYAREEEKRLFKKQIEKIVMEKAGKKLKERGVDWQIISEATGLSVKEIEKL